MSKSAKSESVTYKKKHHIGLITLSNGKYNEIQNAQFLDLDFLRRWIKEEKLKALVITGEGRHFSAGADLKELTKKKHENIAEMLDRGKMILDFIESLPIVTVAAIRGVCLGAGLEIALACRYRICASNATFGFPETQRGLIPGLGGTLRLTEQIGKSKAMYYTLSGERMDAETALKLGIVNKITGKKELKEETLKLIKTMTEHISMDQLQAVLEEIDDADSDERYSLYRMESRNFAKLAANL
ncbi:enoyl-CoA hydratase/isomerase family protein [Zhenpiania hominis]|uniref:enoyl-CoA hydratase/isomerase family protein n=1 Tax=Zhenpiania hominis TaxID=2763644 RepID=UPI0039F6427C